MPAEFSRSLRSLEADSFGPSLIAIACAVLLLAAWGLWFFLAEVDVYEVSPEARLEALSSAHAIEAPVNGRIVATHMTVGQEVEVGHPLVVLETARESTRLREEEALLESLHDRLGALEKARAAELDAGSSARHGDREATERARAQHQEAASAADLARAQLDRTLELRDQGLVSDAELEQAQSLAEQRRAAAEAAMRGLASLGQEQKQHGAESQARMADWARQIAVVRGEIEVAEAAIERLGHELEQRVIRSPIAGRLGEAGLLQAGSVVEEGERIAVVIPDGELKIVGLFPAGSALGRIRPGQESRLRLNAFPWMRFGQVEARVIGVGDEALAGQVRVELAIEDDGGDGIPLQHGLVGSLAVKVERVSPAELVLRATGKRLEGRPLSSANLPGSHG